MKTPIVSRSRVKRRSVARLRALDDSYLTSLRARLGLARVVDPLFIIAPPRSGSTFLFDVLSKSEELTSFTNREAEHLWWRAKNYDERGEFSDVLNADELTLRERRRLSASFYVEATRHTAQRHESRRDLPTFFGSRPVRYLDKTISNCFHLALLQETFPDARFIFLVRDPRENIASMITGWKEVERFGKPPVSERLQRMGETEIKHWTYPAPPGWQDVAGWPLPRICAWSWMQHVEAMLDAPTGLAVSWIRYEEFTQGHSARLIDVVNWAGLDWSQAMEDHLVASPPSRTTVTPIEAETPEQDMTGELALVADTARRIGYDIR